MTPLEYLSLTVIGCSILGLVSIVLYDIIVSTKEEKSM